MAGKWWAAALRFSPAVTPLSTNSEPKTRFLVYKGAKYVIPIRNPGLHRDPGFSKPRNPDQGAIKLFALPRERKNPSKTPKLFWTLFRKKRIIGRMIFRNPNSTPQPGANPLAEPRACRFPLQRNLAPAPAKRHTKIAHKYAINCPISTLKYSRISF